MLKDKIVEVRYDILFRIKHVVYKKIVFVNSVLIFTSWAAKIADEPNIHLFG